MLALLVSGFVLSLLNLSNAAAAAEEEEEATAVEAASELR